MIDSKKKKDMVFFLRCYLRTFSFLNKKKKKKKKRKKKNLGMCIIHFSTFGSTHLSQQTNKPNQLNPPATNHKQKTQLFFFFFFLFSSFFSPFFTFLSHNFFFLFLFFFFFFFPTLNNKPNKKQETGQTKTTEQGYERGRKEGGITKKTKTQI